MWGLVEGGWLLKSRRNSLLAREDLQIPFLAQCFSRLFDLDSGECVKVWTGREAELGMGWSLNYASALPHSFLLEMQKKGGGNVGSIS